ncbi:MAG: hypothetical protein LBE67_18055 [Kocuria palustris]|nr:hypothetical protein [Kocuria palustris]
MSWVFWSGAFSLIRAPHGIERTTRRRWRSGRLKWLHMAPVLPECRRSPASLGPRGSKRGASRGSTVEATGFQRPEAAADHRREDVGARQTDPGM